MRHIKSLGTRMPPRQPPTPRRIPSIHECVPYGQIGYEDLKSKYRLEAWRDREASKIDCDPWIEEQAFITKISWCWLQINAREIAENIEPWDREEFKRRVAEAVIRYKKAQVDFAPQRALT